MYLGSDALNVEKEKTILRRIYKNYDKNRYQGIITSIPWNNNNCDVNVLANINRIVDSNFEYHMSTTDCQIFCQNTITL